MRYNLLLLSLLGLILSCSGLPRVYPAAGSADSQPGRVCRGQFPQGDWQLLHSIEATLPGGKSGFLMGLTVISSTKGTARVVIMTLEGFVLFDASYDGQITVERAIAPFDSEVFANGLIEDIKLIFFKPSGPITTSGLLKNGAAVCRYQKPDGRLVDIVNQGGPSWEIRQYRPDNRLAQTVTITSAKETNLAGPKGISDKIELKAHGAPEYELVMELVDAVPLTK